MQIKTWITGGVNESSYWDFFNFQISHRDAWLEREKQSISGTISLPVDKYKVHSKRATKRARRYGYGKLLVMFIKALKEDKLNY